MKLTHCKKGLFGLRSLSPLRPDSPNLTEAPCVSKAYAADLDHITGAAPHSANPHPVTPNLATPHPVTPILVTPHPATPHPGAPRQARHASPALDEPQTVGSRQEDQTGHPSGGSRAVTSEDSKESRATAKYTYKARPDSPLGPPGELSIATKEPLMALGAHSANQGWTRVRNKAGEIGYVPTSYLLIDEGESEATSMPWIQNKPPPPKPTGVYNPGVPKPFQSAYSQGAEAAGSGAPASQYRCEVCCKSFNGPLPHRAHMASRAHREEMEVRDGYAVTDSNGW